VLSFFGFLAPVVLPHFRRAFFGSAVALQRGFNGGQKLPDRALNKPWNGYLLPFRGFCYNSV
jgi:hypothetical protein